MVKVWGQNSNSNTVKQMAENGQNILGVDAAASIESLVPGIKNSRLWNGLEFHRAQYVYYGRSRTNWFRMIMNILNCSRDLVWRRGGTMTSQELARAIFFDVCLTTFQFKFWRRTFIIGFYRKKSIGLANATPQRSNRRCNLTGKIGSKET